MNPAQGRHGTNHNMNAALPVSIAFLLAACCSTACNAGAPAHGFRPALVDATFDRQVGIAIPKDARPGRYGPPVGLYPACPPPAPTVDVVDVSALPKDLRLSLTMLQGLANRGSRSRVYLIQSPEGDGFWLRHLQAKGYVKRTRSLTADQFLAEYGRVYRKVFVYDPAMSGSINAAFMLGALESGLACAPGDRDRLAGGRPVEDLRGRWKTNAEAIAWAHRTLARRMHRRMLACMNPVGDQIWLYDYLTAHRVFTFWITGTERQDGKVSDHRAERAVVEAVLRDYPPNIPVLGFWSSGQDPGIGEYTGVGLAGETGQFTVASNLCSNLSMLSGIRVDLRAAVKRFQTRLARRTAPELQHDRVYVCFEFTESGDSPFYLQHVQWKQWQDPARGRLPFNWNIGAPVLDLAPCIMEWYLDHATPNDYFCLAPSGIGYTHPYRGLFSRTAEPERAWNAYIGLTRDAMRRISVRDLQLYTDAWVPFDRSKRDPVTLRFADGIPELRSLILGMGRDENMNAENGNYILGKHGVLVSHCLTRWDPQYARQTKEERIAWLANEVRAHAPKGRPGFMHAMVLSWAYDPSDYVELVRRLGPEYVPVTIGEYVRLYRQRTQVVMMDAP